MVSLEFWDSETRLGGLGVVSFETDSQQCTRSIDRPLLVRHLDHHEKRGHRAVENVGWPSASYVYQALEERGSWKARH